MNTVKIIHAGQFSNSTVTTGTIDERDVICTVICDDIPDKPVKPKPIKKRVLPPVDAGKQLKPSPGFTPRINIVKKP